MRRRVILSGMAGMAGTIIAQPMHLLAQPLIPGDDGDTATTPPSQPPANDPPTAPSAPAPAATAAPAPVSRPASQPASAPVAVSTPAPARVDSSKPDPNDPRYSPNAYPPPKQTLDGAPQLGEFALTTDDLNLRANPSTNSEVRTIIGAGGAVTIEGAPQDGFYPVNYQSSLGWVDGKYLRRLAPELPTTVGVGTLLENTPLFDAPNASGKQIASWRAGIPVSYYGEVDGGQYQGSKRWYKVLANPDRFISTWSVLSTPIPALQGPSPLPKSGPLAWVGQMQSAANIRVGPGTSHDTVKTWPAGRRVLVYAEAKGDAYAGSTKWYQVAAPPEQSLFVHASFVTKVADVLPVDKAPFTGRWIDVDLGKQVLTAYLGQTPILVSQIASGTNAHPTDKGTYPTFWRLVMQRMQGDNRFSDDYYNLDAVPYISYFHPSGEAIHGTYWHDSFGTQQSHGCVNTSIPISQWVLTWAPLGTRVVVH